MEDTLSIQGFNLGDYTQQVIEALRQGYTMSLDNDKYPYSFGGGSYFAIFVKQQAIPQVPVTIPVNEVNEVALDKVEDSDVESKPRTRKSK